MGRVMLIDSDILIDAGRNEQKAVAFLDDAIQHNSAQVSVVSHMELIVGCRNRSELRALDRFLTRFEIVGLTDGISRLAVDLLREYRLSHGLLIPDALIAATTLDGQMSLATKNKRDFAFIEGLELADY
jgi:predicted nucleic acid-binding protein